MQLTLATQCTRASDSSGLESGGPEVLPPRERGSGTRIIERSLARDHGAQVKLEFLPLALSRCSPKTCSVALGYEIDSSVANLEDGLQAAANHNFYLAVPDVNLRAAHSYPIADVRIERGIPLIFASGCAALTQQKPFTADLLRRTLVHALANAHLADRASMPRLPASRHEATSQLDEEERPAPAGTGLSLSID